MQNIILIIEFLNKSKKKVFNLELISHRSIDSGGIPQQNIYELVLDNEFLDFWKYIRNKFGVAIFTKIENSKDLEKPNKATIISQIRSIDSNLPWIHKLEVSDDKTTESIIFAPFTCELKENE